MQNMPLSSNESRVSTQPSQGFQIDNAQNLIDLGKRLGADAIEVVYAQNRALSVGVRKGELENIESDETCDLGVRAFVGQKSAVASVSELSPVTLSRLMERVVAMAKLSPDDPYAGLPDRAALYKGNYDIDLQLFDPSDLPAQALKARALEIEALGLEQGAALSSDGASAGLTQNQWFYLSSDGFEGHHKTSLFFQSGRFIATDAAGNMERDGDGRSTRFLSDLPPALDTAKIAAQRALKALGAQKIASQKCPVIFDQRISKSLIGIFLGAVSGTAIARGSSFLKNHLGKAVFSESITLFDDPSRVRGLGSCWHDDEGIEAVPRNLVDKGVLTTWLLNEASARQLGMNSTGHASRGLASPSGVSAHNVTLSAGSQSVASLMSDVKSGVLITSMFGPSVNSDTGDWSAGASGFWFEGGVIAYPVNEITVAGNLIDMFARIVPADDLEIKGSLDCPSLLIDGLSIGGK